jgi:hypothetical protein
MLRGEAVPPDERIPRMAHHVDAPDMQEAECPYCERLVLVFEDPPRCPLCACPLLEARMRPYVWPDEEPSPSG